MAVSISCCLCKLWGHWGAIPAYSDILETEGRHKKHFLNKITKKCIHQKRKFNFFVHRRLFLSHGLKKCHHIRNKTEQSLTNLWMLKKFLHATPLHDLFGSSRNKHTCIALMHNALITFVWCLALAFDLDVIA
jgi:hypothetical protein